MLAPGLLLEVAVALSLNAPVSGDISPGAPQSFALHLASGDYVNATFTQRGKIRLGLYLPDGSLMRKSLTSAPDGEHQLALAAAGAGDYRIELIADEPAHYELRVDKIMSLDERLEAEPETALSPRIESLRKQVASGSDTAGFWKEVAAEGTPLIEPLGTDGKYSLVTFLWRATYDTRNVFVRGPLSLPTLRLSDLAMHHVENTDVWYLTLKIPAGARFSYRLSPNDPLVFDGPRTSQRAVTSQADPLNPHRWSCDYEGSVYACSSYVELPGAPPRDWFVKKPGVPEGKVEMTQFHSDIEKLDRTIGIYTPANYGSKGKPSHLLVVFDGDDHVEPDFALPTTLDNLIAAGKIPPTVAVLVNHPGGRRLKDLLLNQEFADSMAKELVPWVRKRYNVSAKAAQTIVAGHSAGGVGAIYMAFAHPEVFGNVLSQSAAVWWSPEMELGKQDATNEPNWLARQFIVKPRSSVRFYLEAGTFEVDLEARGTGLLESNRQLRDVLLAKGYEVHYQQPVGGHDTVSWRGTFADGLLALLTTEKTAK